MKFYSYIQLLRPQQWIKNLFVVAPLFFSGRFADGNALMAVALAFVAFCLMSSAIYCVNDVADFRNDAKHEKKRRRPVASGAVSRTSAIVVAVALAAASLGIAIAVNAKLLTVLGIYLILNLLYSLGLKRIAVLDVLIVASGFVLRLFAGGVATDVVLSKWIVISTFLLALFLAFAKRRDDVLRMNETGEAPRKNTIRYNLTFINEAITITAGVTLVCYIMYTVSPEVVQNFHTDYLYLTSIFVLVGLLRYIQIAVVDKKSGDPTKVILRDTFTQLVVLAWGLAFLVIIYLM